MRSLLLVVGVVGLAFGSMEVVATPGTIAPRASNPLTPPRSYVIGTADAPTGGEIVVGLVVPESPGKYVKDVLGPERYEAFLRREAEIAKGLSEEDDGDDVVYEMGEDSYWRGDRHERFDKSWRRQARAHQLIAESVSAVSNVRMRFMEVMASECSHVPLLLLANREMSPHERHHLDAYVAGGGRLIRGKCARNALGDGGLGTKEPELTMQGMFPAPSSAKAIARIVAELLKTSKHIVPIERDPFELISARRNGDETIVQFALAADHASLRFADGSLLDVPIKPESTLRFVSPQANANPFHVSLHVDCRRQGVSFRRSWTMEQLVGITDARFLASSRAYAGGTYAVRAIYTNSKSGDPVGCHKELIKLVQGERVLAHATIPSNDAGIVNARLAIPHDAKAGPATLHVGPDTRSVTVKRSVRVSLVTDRTLYRANDRVHTRVMVHEIPSGRPAAGRSVSLRCGKSRKDVVTSSFGIASASFELVNETAGCSKVSAVVDGTTKAAGFQVAAYETPTFRIDVEPKTLHLDRGQSGTVSVTVTTLSGDPMVGAKVSFEPLWCRVTNPEKTTNKHGQASAKVTRSGRLGGPGALVRVTDADGRTISHELTMRSASKARSVQFRALSELVAGQPCRFGVRAKGRSVIDLKVDSSAYLRVALDNEGNGTFVAFPDSDTLVIEGEGFRARSFDVLAVDPEHPEPTLLLDKRVADVGESLTGKLLGPNGPVLLDVLREGVLIRTLSAQIKDGRGNVSIPLEPDLAGHLEIRVYTSSKEDAEGTRVQVLVGRGRTLTVDAKTDAESYRPGETATLDVEVRDPKGVPAPGVLGYWAIDQAVLDLSSWSEGNETRFDLASDNRQGTLLKLADGNDHRAMALSVLGPIKNLDKYHKSEYSEGRAKAQRANAKAQSVKSAKKWMKTLRLRGAEALASFPLAQLRATYSLRETLEWLTHRGAMARNALLDPWGTPLLIQNSWTTSREYDEDDEDRDVPRLSYHYTIERAFPCISAGPDRQMNTSDDIHLAWFVYLQGGACSEPLSESFWRFMKAAARAIVDDDQARNGASVDVIADTSFFGPLMNGAIGIGGGGGGAFSGRGGSRDLGTGGGGRRRYDPPVQRVRRNFLPTLCFVPEAIVGPNGKAKLKVNLADNITTWKTRLVASTAEGATGIGYADIVVNQPLHATPWISRHLTDGDELELPVAVRNGTDQPMTTILRLDTTKPLHVVGEAEASVVIPARGTAAHRFRIRASGHGTSTIKIRVEPGDHVDIVEHTVTVRRDAKEVIASDSTVLTAGSSWTPSFGHSGSEPIDIAIYPSAMADVVGGFEGLIRKPRGCFEQTSSTLYPMVLALDYLQRTGQTNAALEDRARKFVSSGYQRLLGFEVRKSPGGFSLFGHSPASTFLTAYGLMEFTDMARVHDVDADVAPRMIKFLRGKQNEDGSWGKPTQQAHQELSSHGAFPSFNGTAYTAWALAKAGERTDVSLEWLKQKIGDVTSTYSLSLAALAFLEQDPKSPIGSQLVARLVDVAREREGAVTWQSEAPTGLGARGRVARIETSALAVQALVKERQNLGIANLGLAGLIQARSPDGRFGTTQSTVLALQALIAADAAGPKGGSATVRFNVGDRELARETITPNTSSISRHRLQVKPNEVVTTTLEGTRSVRVGASQPSWKPWSETPKPTGRVNLDVKYPANMLEVARPAFAEVILRNTSKKRASLVTAEIGIPPGCDIDVRTIRASNSKARFLKRIERSEDSIVLYLLNLKPGASRKLKIPFVPRHQLDVKTTPSTAYEYYVPHEAAVVPPQHVRANWRLVR